MKTLFLLTALFTSSLIAEDFAKPPYQPTITDLKEIKAYNKILALLDEKPEEALKLIEKHDSKTRSAVFDYLQAAILIGQNSSDKAIPFLQTAIKKYPTFISAHDALYKSYWDKGEMEKARVALLKIISLGQGTPKQWQILGDLYTEDKDYANAETAYRQARIFLPKDKTLSTKLAFNYYEQEQYARSISLFKSLLKADVKNKSLRIALAQSYIELGRKKDATQQLEIAYRLKLLNEQETLLLAQLYEEQNQNAIANKLYIRLAKSDKISNKNRIALIGALLSNEQFSEVETLLQELKKQKLDNETNESLALIEGQILQAKQDFPKALSAFERALKFNSINAEALLGTAQVYQFQKEFVKAEHFFKRATTQKDVQIPALLGLSQSLTAQGKYQEGLKVVDKLVKLSPEKQYIKYHQDLKSFIEKNQK